jgi:hypothetical protein
MPGPGGLGAGGVDGVGGPVVLAGLPDDWVPVVLAAVVDGHPDPQGEGGFAVADGGASVVAALVGGHAELGIQPVEGLLGVADGVPLGVGVEVVEHVGQACVVVAVAGGQVAAEAACDLVDGPVAELMTAEGGWGLQVLQQLCSALYGVGVLLLVGVWRPGWGGV